MLKQVQVAGVALRLAKHMKPLQCRSMKEGWEVPYIVIDGAPYLLEACAHSKAHETVKWTYVFPNFSSHGLGRIIAKTFGGCGIW